MRTNIDNSNSNFFSKHSKPVFPNSEMSGEPANTKTYLSKFEYILLNKHAKYSDQHMGAGHTILGKKEAKIMKICTIIFIGTMILVLKVLAMFTLSMGTPMFESVIFIYRWMPTRMAFLVTGVFIFLVNFTKIRPSLPVNPKPNSAPAP